MMMMLMIGDDENDDCDDASSAAAVAASDDDDDDNNFPSIDVCAITKVFTKLHIEYIVVDTLLAVCKLFIIRIYWLKNYPFTSGARTVGGCPWCVIVNLCSDVMILHPDKLLGTLCAGWVVTTLVW